MSFGAEFRNMRAAGGAPKITETAAKEAETVASEKAAAPPPEVDPQEATFSQPFVDGQAMEDSAPQLPPVIPAPKVETKKAIKINGKTFESEEEAYEYAANLERELEKKEAYAKGLEDSKPKVATPAEKKKILKIAEKLFEDPEATFEELEAHIIELAERKMNEMDNKKTEAQQKAEQMKKDVDNFYKNNSDLVEWQDEVDLVVKNNWASLSQLPKDQIMVEAARLSRAYVASVKERALPKSALASRPAHTASSGMQSTTTTQQPATEKKVSFAAQVRSTNRRTAMQGEV